MTADQKLPATLDLAAMAHRYRFMLEALNVDGREFTERIGVPYSTMRTYVAGGRAPSAEFLAGCFRGYGVMPSWLLTGDEPMFRAGFEKGPQGFEPEVLTVPMLEIRASEVPGSLNHASAEYKVPGLCITNSWLAEKGLSAASLRVIKVRGASMQGVLSDGDLVLVDQSDTATRSGFVYVVRQAEELLVKYCQLLSAGVLRLSSANPAFPPYDIDLSRSTDVAVIGRVVASMHDW